MSDFKPRPGTFLPYMEAQLRSEKAARTTPLTLLEILSRQAQKSLSMFDLQSRSGMEPTRYVEALKALSKAGYINVEGEPLEQMIRLTDTGAQVVSLAQPAGL